MSPRAVLPALLLALALALGAGAAVAAVPEQAPDPSISDGTRQRDLDRARALWKADGLRSYRFELRRRCFCPEQSNVVVLVRNRRIVKHPPELRPVASVPRLFRTIQQAIDDKAVQLDVSYGKRGVPRSLYVDRSKNVIDEETGYTIKRFTSLKQRAG